MIWFALLIPLITSLILFSFFKKKIEWYELLIPIPISLVLILISVFAIETIQCQDTEYLTGWVDHVKYYEAWNELVTYTETETYTVGKETRTRTVVKTRVDYHSPEWILIDSNGCQHYISQKDFEYFCKSFGNRKFHELNRNYYSLDGNLYISVWNKKEETMQVVNSTKSYSNRIIASNNVYKFENVSKEDKQQYQLFDYPKIKLYDTPHILGINDAQAERSLSLLNAKIGKDKQIRIWILVFNNQPLEAAFLQQQYWQNGNKNELVLCIGNENNKIIWSHCFSWTESERLKIECRDLVYSQKELDLKKIILEIQPLVDQYWKKKEFEDFNYINVYPPIWCVILVYIFTLGANIGCVIFSVNKSNHLYK